MVIDIYAPYKREKVFATREDRNIRFTKIYGSTSTYHILPSLLLLNYDTVNKTYIQDFCFIFTLQSMMWANN